MTLTLGECVIPYFYLWRLIMSFKTVQGTHCGHVKTHETVLRTGTLEDVNVLIFQIKDKTTGLYSFRYFPHTEAQSFVDRGVRYANNLGIATVKKSLKHFENVQVVAQDRSNAAHMVYSWTNMWAWDDSPMRQNETNGKFSMVLELNVPATGWIFEFISPEVDSQAAVTSAIYDRFRAHFQGCMIKWKAQLTPTTTQPAKKTSTSIEEDLFG